MMWIRSIRLKNFKSYASAEFKFPKPNSEQNIVLIGAENGHGKTTLLEAIYLCLYDKDAVSHFKRAGLNNEDMTYPVFLNQALYHGAEPRYGIYRMELEIEISQIYQGKHVSLRIHRKWTFDDEKRCNIQDNQVMAHLVEDDSPRILDEGELGFYLNAYAVPSDYASFFFFDGEKIVSVAERSGAGDWLHSALRGLLGVELLGRLKDSLHHYKAKCISENASKKMQEELLQAERNLEMAQASLSICQELYQEALQNAENWETKRDSLMNQLGGGSDIAHSQDLIKRREQIEQEYKSFQNSVKEAVVSMPLAFLPRERLQQLSKTLAAEEVRLNHEAAKEQVAERVDDFWNAFMNSEKVKEVLGRSASHTLQDPLMKEAVAECWDKLFYPLPDNCADTIQHNYLSLNAHADIRAEMGQMSSLTQDKLGDVLTKIDQHEREKSDLTARIESLKSSGNDELVEQLKEANVFVSRCNDETGRLKNNYDREKQVCKQLERDVINLQNQVSDSNPRLVKSKRAGMIENAIARIQEELLKEKASILGETATRINQALSHDQRIDRVRIEPTGRMRLFGRDGLETTVALSAGQMQILIMALVSALAEVTQYKAPFVIDTPLARLDEGHREGLFNLNIGRVWSSK